MDYTKLSSEELIALVRSKDEELSSLKARLERLDAPAIKQAILKLKTQNQEISKRERALMQKLVLKEEEIRVLYAEVQSFKVKGKNSADNLSKVLLDPAVNILFEQMRRMLKEKDEKIEKLTSELEAVQYSTNSLLGKRLLAKCNSLVNENEELGNLLSVSRSEQMERELVLQKKLSDELKKALVESDEVVVQLDEDMERAQEQILHLETRIREAEQEREKREIQWEREREAQRSRAQDREVENEGRRRRSTEEEEDDDGREPTTPTQQQEADGPQMGSDEQAMQS